MTTFIFILKHCEVIRWLKLRGSRVRIIVGEGNFANMSVKRTVRMRMDKPGKKLLEVFDGILVLIWR